MALGDILARILDDAREEAREIRSRGEAGAEKILAEARVEAGLLREELLRRGEEALRHELENELSRLRVEAGKEVLAMKRELLADLFRKVPSALQDQGAREYADFLAGLVDEGSTVDSAVVEIGGKDLEKFGDSLPALFKEAAARRFPRWSFTLSSRAGAFGRGLIVRTDRLVNNLSLQTLLAGSRERMEVDVAEILFSP